MTSSRSKSSTPVSNFRPGIEASIIFLRGLPPDRGDMAPAIRALGVLLRVASQPQDITREVTAQEGR